MQLFRGPRAAEYRVGVKAVLPFAAVIATVGVLFGYLARAAGLSPLAAVLMSGTTFAGSAQFVAVAGLPRRGPAGGAVRASAPPNARALPLGVRMAAAQRGPVCQRRLRV